MNSLESEQKYDKFSLNIENDLNKKAYAKEYRLKNHAKNIEYKKQYRENNKKNLADKQKLYYKEHRSQVAKYKSQYYKDNKNKILENRKEYCKNHNEAIVVYNNKYRKVNRATATKHHKIRLATDINYKLAHYIRKRLRAAVKHKQKVGSTIKDLGCSIEELKLHIEKQFQPYMDWENWKLVEGWHIDHIIPLSHFDLTNREQFLKACHYTNLQPLWAEDNLKKSNKLNNTSL